MEVFTARLSKTNAWTRRRRAALNSNQTGISSLDYLFSPELGILVLKGTFIQYYPHKNNNGLPQELTLSIKFLRGTIHVFHYL
jgi:hypothetical protein